MEQNNKNDITSAHHQDAVVRHCPYGSIEGFVPQMKRKGRLQEDMDADIVVFDPETISNVGIYDKPS